MKSFFQDVVLTLLVKGVLLYLLWFFCVKSIPSYWHNSSEWMLTHNFVSNSSSMHSLNQQTKGVYDDSKYRH